MTCIAWDGRTLAADKLADGFGLARTTTKIQRIGPALVGVCGHADAGREMLEWYRRGAKEDDFPEAQRARSDGNSRCSLVVIGPNGHGVLVYETTPYPIEFEDRQFATGSGRDYALAAMYCGKSAREAVEIACVFETGCGNGIDVLEL